MIDREPLSLHEEVLLLALRDDKGTIASGAMYHHAIAAGLLSELILRKRVEIDDPEGKKLVRVINEGGTRSPLLDECLAKIAGDKPRKLEQWVAKFAGLKNLKHRVAEPLCAAGILREEEGTILLVFSRKLYPTTDSRPEQQIVQRLRRAIFTDDREVDARTVVLTSLVNATGILTSVFERKELKPRKDRLKQLENGELVSKAARDAIQAMQTAVLLTTIMPSIIATTVHH